jgi:hypothetical protein
VSRPRADILGTARAADAHPAPRQRCRAVAWSGSGGYDGLMMGATECGERDRSEIGASGRRAKDEHGDGRGRLPGLAGGQCGHHRLVG